MNGSRLLIAVAAAVLLCAACNNIDQEWPPRHVRMTAAAFVPDSTVINKGEAVTWVNLGHTNHTVTSGADGVPDSIWDSPTILPGDSYTRVFNKPGRFPYFDRYHRQSGMKGRVIVQGTPDFNVESVDVYVIQWLPAPDSNLIHFRLSAPTTGWVSIGFNSQPVMARSNMVIGFVRNDSAFARDFFSPSGWACVFDTSYGGQDNVTDVSGAEQGGNTELRFTIPLVSGDSCDFPMSVGGTYSIILARGFDGADDYTSIHNGYAIGTIHI